MDLAYHFEKARDADELIDIWGADHAGTVMRIVAAAEALTEGRKRFDVKLVQIVRLLRAAGVDNVMCLIQMGTLTQDEYIAYTNTVSDGLSAWAERQDLRAYCAALQRVVTDANLQ